MANSERLCLGCNQRFARSELIKLTYFEGRVCVDIAQKLPGRRSFYLCRKPACLSQARSKLHRPLNKWRARHEFRVAKSDLEELLDGLRIPTKELSGGGH